MKEGIESSKQKFLNDPSVAKAFDSLGVELKRHMVRRLTETKDSDPPLAKDMAKLLDRLGDMLAEDPFTRQMVNERLRAAIPSFVEESRDTLSSIISKTVKDWNGRQTSDRIELYIGRDLAVYSYQRHHCWWLGRPYHLHCKPCVLLGKVMRLPDTARDTGRAHR